MAGDITIAELIRNGTMSGEVAGLLWAAADEQTSFLTVAVPRFAGKTTTSKAILDLRRAEVPLHPVAGEEPEMERLERERRGGYLVVAEFSQAPVSGYIWGGPVRRVFEAAKTGGYALQAALHAPGPEEAIRVVTEGNGVSDEEAAIFKLVVYIERFGDDLPNFWRRIAQVYEVDGVEKGRALGRTLYRWRSDGDAFDQLSEPRQFGRDEADRQRRAAILDGLAKTGRTAEADVRAAIRAYAAGAA